MAPSTLNDYVASERGRTNSTSHGIPCVCKKEVERVTNLFQRLFKRASLAICRLEAAVLTARRCQLNRWLEPWGCSVEDTPVKMPGALGHIWIMTGQNGTLRLPILSTKVLRRRLRDHERLCAAHLRQTEREHGSSNIRSPTQRSHRYFRRPRTRLSSSEQNEYARWISFPLPNLPELRRYEVSRYEASVFERSCWSRGPQARNRL